MRVTRFQMIVGATVLASVPIMFGCTGVMRWGLLSGLFSVAGTWIGLGVSFPQFGMFGESLCAVATDRRRVALTFDDGPDPDATPALLDVLAQEGIRATFFCVGERVARHPDLVRRMTEAGHQIENHSHRHSHWTNLLSTARLRADVQQAQRTIQEVTGRAPRFFRPPMGLTNQRVFRVARELDLRVTGYTARGLDTRPDSPEQIAARVLRGLRPGAILLLHDGGVSAARLLAVVRLVVDKLQAGDYQCRRLDELVLDASLK